MTNTARSRSLLELKRRLCRRATSMFAIVTSLGLVFSGCGEEAWRSTYTLRTPRRIEVDLKATAPRRIDLKATAAPDAASCVQACTHTSKREPAVCLLRCPGASVAPGKCPQLRLIDRYCVTQFTEDVEVRDGRCASNLDLDEGTVIAGCNEERTGERIGGPSPGKVMLIVLGIGGLLALMVVLGSLGSRTH